MKETEKYESERDKLFTFIPNAYCLLVYIN